jgi:uncharacterized repeat protein (TIGR01451 family)
MRHLFSGASLALAILVTSAGLAQPLQKSAIQTDPGNTKQTGAVFGYRLTYNCSNTLGPCLSSQVVDLLPAGLQFDSTVPASPTGDVAAINVTPNFGGSGRTRVQFVMITPLPAGNSGDLIINVHFPNGSTPDGTVATNTADGINLDTTPGTFTTPPVNVTAVAALHATVTKSLTTSPANLDLPETYRLRISNQNVDGTLNLTSIGPVVDTLPPGTVFNGATPAADCQPGCVGTTPPTVTWTSPCTVPLQPNQNCDVLVNVTFPSATFPSGTNVTNSFTADVTPLGEPPASLGPGTTTHPVTTFVPSPGMSLAKNMAGGTPNPPTLNQPFSYDVPVSNNGNVPIDNVVVIDTLPVELQVSSVTTGAYSNLTDFAAGEGVRVSYEKNTALGVFTLWGSSPNTTTNTTLTAPPPGLGAGEYITKIRWEYGQAAVGMSASTNPRITGTIINPDNAGGPVAFGDTIQNCVALTGVYTAGPTAVSRNACRTFTLSGPFVQLNPAKDNLSGGGPFNPGQSVSFRLRVRSAPQSSDPAPLDGITLADLLPIDLIFSGWTFDDQGTGLPAPQNFTQIPNYAGTGRTLLRWTWNAGSGNLGVNQQVFVNITTTVRNGARSGSLSNTMALTSSTPGLAQRCSGSSQPDPLDLDGDANTAETLCTATGTINVAGIAQLISSKTIKGTCDGGAVSTSAGTLTGGGLEYHLRVQNVGTVSMQNFVLIDILPFVGDTGVRDTNPRGSQWTPLLAAPITPPPGTTIYYSTAGNPCRGEVGGPTTGCTPPNWTTVAPDPITSVRSFKVEFQQRVAAPFDFIEFDFVMVTPGNVPAGQFAYNSFAYQADRSDGLGSLAAEPVKVGVSLGACDAASLGDYVWVDTNHDGIQNDGPTGRNGVYTQLFSPGTDGLTNTNDDVPLASTVTTNSPTSEPGWYEFPGLAPGNYYVRIVPPPTFDITSPNATADNQDSDANPITATSPVVTLAANENNPTIDFGLVATHTAALGDYVWFDLDSDGVQNESPFSGANGVTVQLFVDDGDSSPDPGDLLVRTTVTADDVYGRPGYYFFDELIPGLPYYVKFVTPAVATGFTAANSGGDDTVDSDANVATGVTPIVTLAPDEVNRTIDAGLVTPTGTLALGDQVWLDNDNDGVFEPENGELGIDDVGLDLYRDVNNDGLPSLDEYLSTTNTQTISGFAGKYSFTNLAPGNYIVVVSSDEFNGGGELNGRGTSTGNDPAPDPDDDVNGDDNGTNSGALIASHPVTLTSGGEPTSEDGNASTNLTVDFGFIPNPPAVLFYDYGDAPDVGAGTAKGNYNTTALDSGASHLLGVPNAPFLGSCVDADDGFLQSVNADADDTGLHALTIGTCSVADDDENGVTFSGPFTPGSTATFSVTSGGPTPCSLDAWVDWNQNGVFTDAGEQIATSLSIPVGPPAILTPSVPAGALPGNTYARFRCSSSGGLTPTGTAADGEVEDYLVGITGYDYGDAPASFGTQGAGAARHLVNPTTPLRLGQCLDTEPDGQPSVNANGDDTTAGTAQFGACLDDEDGVTFTSPLVACVTSNVSVVANASALLDAWIDFNRDGSFGVTEQIFTSLPVVAGTNSLAFNVPCTAVAGTSYARFRISTAGGLTPTGDAADGEVEDYAVVLGTVDFGDAPDTYSTLFASSGPHHASLAGFSLGATEDTEADGQPSAAANGDGADEDGVTLPASLVACSTVNLPVSLTNTAGVATPRLDAWMDFDGDGQFNDPRDRIATGLAITAGANSVPVNIPCNARTSQSYARFRLSSTGSATPTGAAVDGEVEDYAVALEAYDLGDAPDSYHTLVGNTGARHLVISGFSLGATIDAELDGQPNAGANGDGADEDGVTLPGGGVLQGCTTATLSISLTNTAAVSTPRLDAWIDFDGDGQFNDPRDRIATALALTPGANSLNVNVPCDTTTTTTYARFRLTSGGIASPAGDASTGEVEDYLVSLQALDFGDAPDSYGTTLAASGPRHVLIAGFSLGATTDSEADGQPSAGANGDGSDEDGATIPTLVGCSSANLSVALTNTAAIATPRLDAWIDFDGDGQFNDPGDRVATSLALAAGANSVPVNVPCSVTSRTSYARFRLSSAGVATPTAAASDGEIEDFTVSLQGVDFGDLADPAYPTLLASNGARHAVLATGNPTLGSTVDTEANGAPSAAATGDDAAGVDDEDGVSFPGDLVAGMTGVVHVTTGSTGGNVSLWIDFDGDGNLAEPGEQILTDQPMSAGAAQDFPVLVPVGAIAGNAGVRARISSQTGLGVTGLANDGEVEDYVVPLVPEDPEIGTTLRIVSVTPTGECGVVDVVFEVGLSNSGNVTLNNVQASLVLNTVFVAPATYSVTSVTSATLPEDVSFNGGSNTHLLLAGAVLQPGESGTIQITVHLNATCNKVTYTLTATGEGDSPGGEHVTDTSQDGDQADPDNDNDPSDNSDPTVLALDPVQIPTLDEWALLAVAALLASIAAMKLRS